MTQPATTRLTAWLLRTRARRLPDDLSARLLEEWLAETVRMSNPGKLAFAVSLLLTRTTTLVQAGTSTETSALARAIAADGRRYVAARLSRRLVASLVDFAFLSALTSIPYLLFTSSLGTLPVEYLVSSMLSLTLETGLVVRYGGSVGKLVMKLRIIPTDSRTLTLRHALGRSVPTQIVFGMPQVVPLVFLVWTGAEAPGYVTLSSVEQEQILRTLAPPGLVTGLHLFALAWLAVEVMMARLDPDRRSLHDRIGRTMVVYREPRLPDRPDSRSSDRAPIVAR